MGSSYQNYKSTSLCNFMISLWGTYPTHIIAQLGNEMHIRPFIAALPAKAKRLKIQPMHLRDWLNEWGHLHTGDTYAAIKNIREGSVHSYEYGEVETVSPGCYWILDGLPHLSGPTRWRDLMTKWGSNFIISEERPGAGKVCHHFVYRLSTSSA